jgi:hypothetical protein
VNPVTLRAVILVTELTVFFTMTVMATFLISHSSALRFVEEERPPDAFPVLVYAGDRQRPVPENYRVVPWSEWPRLAGEHPGASLIPPETAGTIDLGEDSRATFSVSSENATQTVELTWTVGTDEYHTRYVVHAAHIEPLYYRTMGGRTFLMGALVGFLAGVVVGRGLRRRLLVGG